MKEKKYVDIATNNLENFELYVIRKPIGETLTDFLNLDIKKNFKRIKELATQPGDDIYRSELLDIEEGSSYKLSQINSFFPILQIEYYNCLSKDFCKHLTDIQDAFVKYVELALTDERYYDFNFFQYVLSKDLFNSQDDGYSRIKQKTAFKAELNLFREEKITSYVDFTFFENFKVDFTIIETFKDCYFKNKENELGVCYEVRWLTDACIVEMSELFKRGMIIKKCKNCGKYFIPMRSDALYCDAVSPQDTDKTCKEYGAYEQYMRNIKTSESKQTYRNIYQAKQMLCKRNPDIVEYREDFESFKEQAKQWKTDIKNGVKSDTEFLFWLKEIKQKKVTQNGKHNKKE